MFSACRSMHLNVIIVPSHYPLLLLLPPPLLSPSRVPMSPPFTPPLLGASHLGTRMLWRGYRTQAPCPTLSRPASHSLPPSLCQGIYGDMYVLALLVCTQPLPPSSQAPKPFEHFRLLDAIRCPMHLFAPHFQVHRPGECGAGYNFRDSILHREDKPDGADKGVPRRSPCYGLKPCHMVLKAVYTVSCCLPAAVRQLY